MPEGMLDVLVIGGGQAGLAAGYHLQRAQLSFRILEAAARIGDSWRARYRSLTLFTPRAFSQLPRLRLTGDPEGYPSRNEFADYLESYAAIFKLPVDLNAEVVRLTHEDGTFRARLADGSEVRARAVVVAAGAFQKPLRPALSTGFDTSVVQLDAQTYRGPEDVPTERVLVVGDGATGRDIVFELAATHETFLAVGKPRKLFPERIVGKSVWWWLTRLGLMRVGPQSTLGRLMRRADPFPNRKRSVADLQSRGVRIVCRLVSADDRTATFSDAAYEKIDAVIWAIGYRDEMSWIEIPGAVDDRGSPVHVGGKSPVSGLFFLGRPWQRNRASALVMGVGDDARVIVDQVSRFLSN